MNNPYSSMKEIKVDKITDAQKSLFKGLIELWVKKPCHKISVKELIQVSHVARSTFYVYYQNIDELMESLENYHIMNLIKLNEVLMDSKIDSEGFLEYYQETIQYVKNYRDVFYAFLIANVNNRFIKKWKDAIKYHLLERKHLLSEKKNGYLILELVSADVIAAYSFWLENPDEVDINSLDKVVSQTLKLIEF